MIYTLNQVILVILVYSFGVVTTQLVIEHCRDLAVEALQDVLQGSWGGGGPRVFKAMEQPWENGGLM